MRPLTYPAPQMPDTSRGYYSTASVVGSCNDAGPADCGTVFGLDTDSCNEAPGAGPGVMWLDCNNG